MNILVEKFLTLSISAGRLSVGIAGEDSCGQRNGIRRFPDPHSLIPQLGFWSNLPCLPSWYQPLSSLRNSSFSTKWVCFSLLQAASILSWLVIFKPTCLESRKKTMILCNINFLSLEQIPNHRVFNKSFRVKKVELWSVLFITEILGSHSDKNEIKYDLSHLHLIFGFLLFTKPVFQFFTVYLIQKLMCFLRYELFLCKYPFVEDSCSLIVFFIERWILSFINNLFSFCARSKTQKIRLHSRITKLFCRKMRNS